MTVIQWTIIITTIINNITICKNIYNIIRYLNYNLHLNHVT